MDDSQLEKIREILDPADQLYKYEDIADFGVEVLIKCGVPQEYAKITVNILIEADKRGVKSHGFAGGSSLDDVIHKIREGGINPNPNIQIEDTRAPNTKIIKADGAVGHVPSYMAIELSRKLAKQHGSSRIYICDSSHFGIAGYYSEEIAKDKQFQGRVMCNAPGWAKYFILEGDPRTLEKIMGTNPIAISIPYDEGTFTIDMATTSRAISRALDVGKENKYILEEYNKRTGEKVNEEDVLKDKKLAERIGLKRLEEGYLAGPNGENVLFPLSYEFVRDHCYLRLLGGKDLGYKGLGLNMSVDLEIIEAGGNPSVDIKAGSKEKAGRVSQLVCADIVNLTEGSLKRKGDYIRKLSKKAQGTKFYLPGQKEQMLSAFCESFKSTQGSILVPYTQDQINTMYDNVLKQLRLSDLSVEGLEKPKPVLKSV